MKTTLNGHPGIQDDDFFVFYGLFFDNIIDVAKFLKDIPIRNWKGTNYKGYKYLKDKKTKEIFFYGEKYESDIDIKELINFIDAENK